MWLTGVGQADFDLRDVWPPVCGENGTLRLPRLVQIFYYVWKTSCPSGYIMPFRIYLSKSIFQTCSRESGIAPDCHASGECGRYK